MILPPSRSDIDALAGRFSALMHDRGARIAMLAEAGFHDATSMDRRLMRAAESFIASNPLKKGRSTPAT